MRSKASTLAVAIVAVAILLAWAWAEVIAARQAQASVTAMTKRLEAMAAEFNTARTRVAAATRTEADLVTALRSAQSKNKNAEVVGNKDPRVSLTTLLATNPKVRSLYLRSYRAQLAATYLPLYHRLKLGPTEIEKFNDLLSEREEEKLDLQAAAEAHGLLASDPAIVAVQKRQDADLREAEIGLLGADGFQQIQQVDRLQPLVKVIVTPLMSVIPANAAPLTEAQGEQLLDVLSHSNSPYQAGGNADPLATDWPTVLAQTKGILTDAQYAGLQTWSQIVQVGVLIRQYYQLKAATK